MQFVNINGDPIVAIAKPTRARSRASTEPKHKGWMAVGFSPAQLEAARVEHDSACKRALAAGAPAPAPFDVDAYMRRARPGRIRSQPYSIHEAAHEACRLAERAGWAGCRVESVVTK